ncbi:MAG: hypothetical protein JOZ90_02795 [Alphaproteobacteria bacterium]|nr:hypothetical protein [Alphaproteobacteria bacterium]MBV9370631.1 hypothetical protein [Alphaproteobacteria bacterium]MBV9900005.1 hypothetical protein [Alphaproteobacteria bacterium]
MVRPSLASLLLLLVSAEAAAQEAEPARVASPGLEVGGDVTLLSDYRFRGISRSNGDPALQGRLTFSLPSGLYAGARGTTLKGLASRADLEFDLYAGYTADLGVGTSLDGGILYYAFPGADGASGYVEPYAALSHTLGPVEATLGAKYAPSQRAIGGDDRLYLFGEVEAGIPATPLTLSAQAGWQDAGRFGRYWNWSLGGRYAIGPVEAGLRYVDTDLADLPGQRGGIVASLGFRF